MTDEHRCPACPDIEPTMDRLVDHISDEHGWAVAEQFGELDP